MKIKSLVALLSLASTFVQAQEITIKEGQAIKIETTRKEETNLSGMGLLMNTEAKTTASIKALSSEKATANVSYTLQNVKVTVSAAGQNMSYDSENPADKDSELGQGFADKINKEVKITLNKTKGTAEGSAQVASPEKAEENPMEALMSGGGNLSETDAVASAFMLFDNKLKPGASWVDSSASTPTLKSIKTYTIASISDGIAKIQLNDTVEGSSTAEIQGTSMDINVKTKSDSEIEVDTKTFLVKKRVTKTEASGSIDVMGQSMPFSSNSTVETKYN